MRRRYQLAWAADGTIRQGNGASRAKVIAIASTPSAVVEDTDGVLEPVT